MGCDDREYEGCREGTHDRMVRTGSVFRVVGRKLESIDKDPKWQLKKIAAHIEMELARQWQAE